MSSEKINKVYYPDSGAHRRDGLVYRLTEQEIQQYSEQGYLVLNDFLTEQEVATLDDWFEHFITGKEPNMGRDFCDMSQPYGTPVEEFRLVNAVLPSRYRKELEDNVFMKVASRVAKQLYSTGSTMVDYDQFLAKNRGRNKPNLPCIRILAIGQKRKTRGRLRFLWHSPIPMLRTVALLSSRGPIVNQNCENMFPSITAALEIWNPIVTNHTP